MKFIGSTIGGLLMLGVAGSAAADWKMAYEADGYTSYFDPASIHRNGDLATLFQLRDLKAPTALGDKTYRSQQAALEYNCKRSEVRLRVLTLYAGPMGTGDILDTDSVEGDWKPVASDSMNEQFLRTACATKKP